MNKKFVLWFTGLSGSGKTTLSEAVTQELKKQGLKVHHLDGDEVRAVSKEKLGFNKKDRDKNIELAIKLVEKYQNDNFIVVASFISPYRIHRQWGREKFKNYIEVFVDASLEICEKRDVKGMYKKARAGELKFFTGISDPYEKPRNADIVVNTDVLSINKSVKIILDKIKILI
ncbi:adenylyl-sulfate kinase [Candidatus Parcubacteria bacterium]|nr:adenylyl-sulfate kinase [Candidatus Parcubacteria bacterium]